MAFTVKIENKMKCSLTNFKLSIGSGQESAEIPDEIEAKDTGNITVLNGDNAGCSAMVGIDMQGERFGLKVLLVNPGSGDAYYGLRLMKFGDNDDTKAAVVAWCDGKYPKFSNSGQQKFYYETYVMEADFDKTDKDNAVLKLAISSE